MTQAEFYAAIKEAQNKYLNINIGVNKEISKLYISAADQVAEKIRTLELNSRGTSLTAASLRDLERALRKTGESIAGGSQAVIIDGINKNTSILSEPHIDYINDGISISRTGRIERNVITEIYAAINRRVIDITYSRIWQDGYNFSSRVWGGESQIKEGEQILGLVGGWQDEIKRVVESGIAQNRDIIQIAKDIKIYARKGKKGLVKTYGGLKRGTAKVFRRIPKYIDWRALRLSRSELYASIQESAKIQGRENPAVKKYIWNLTAGGVHNCICPDLAANSPYLENEIPDYPHSNCLCQITHKIMSRNEFVNDLIDWGNGLGVPYLDNWYQNIYLPFLTR